MTTNHVTQLFPFLQDPRSPAYSPRALVRIEQELEMHLFLRILYRARDNHLNDCSTSFYLCSYCDKLLRERKRDCPRHQRSFP